MRYNDFLSSFMFWYPELGYCTLFNFGSIWLSVGQLCTGLINAWFSLAASRHSLTFPFGFDTIMKLLHHSTVSDMPSGVMMSCCCRYSKTSLNGWCGVYAMHFGGNWYSLVSGLAHNENVPLKCPIPLNVSLNSFVGALWFQHLSFCRGHC